MKQLKKKLKMNRSFTLGEVTQRLQKNSLHVRSSGRHKNLAHHKLQIVNYTGFKNK